MNESRMDNRRNAIWLSIIVLLPLGLVTGKSIFFTLAYSLMGLIVFMRIWSWLALIGTRLGRRTHQRRSQVGRAFSETFNVRNLSWLPKLWIEVRDYSDIPGHRASAVVPFLRPRGNYEWKVNTVCMARGEFKLGPMLVSSADPFGLFVSTRRVNAMDSIIVHPPILPLNKFILPVGVLSGGDTQRYLTQQVTPNAAGVRDYVPGDTINRIHWKSTARRNKPIVKEFELDPLVDIWLYVDFSVDSLAESANIKRAGEGGVLMTSTQDLPPSSEEYAVVAAATLANYFIQAKRALGFLAHLPHREYFPPERSTRQLQRILEALAIARSKSTLSLSEALSSEALSFTRGTTLIVITSSTDPIFVQRLQILKMRGIRPLCVYIDPHSFASQCQSEPVLQALSQVTLPTVLLRRGDNLSQALTQRMI